MRKLLLAMACVFILAGGAFATVVEVSSLTEFQAIREDPTGSYILTNNIDGSDVHAYYNSTYTGTVNISGGLAEYTSGDTFRAEWAGGDICIGETVYRISSVTSDTQISVTSCPDATGVKWIYGTGFEKIGAYYFSGTIDGDGHTVDGLYIHPPNGWSYGIILYLSGTVKNLGLTNFLGLSSHSSLGTSVPAPFAYLVTNGGVLEKCYATGKIKANSEGASGLVRELASGGTVKDCFSRVSVFSTTRRVGGGVYYTSSGATLLACYSTGIVSGTTDVLGWGSGTIAKNNTFWDTETSGNSTASAVATGKTTTQMKTLSTYSNISIPIIGESLGTVMDESLNTDYYPVVSDSETVYLDDGMGGWNTTTNYTINYTTGAVTITDWGTSWVAKIDYSVAGDDWDFTTVWGMKSTINDGYPMLRVFGDDFSEGSTTKKKKPQVIWWN